MSNIKDRKTALLYKEKLLEDINYYGERIKEFHANSSSARYYEESDSSEDEFPPSIDHGPSVNQLKQQALLLTTCLQATQELTSLQVLEFKGNVLIDDPVINGVPMVTEPGIWREVVAKCRIDLVPFSIMFNVHQPSRLFGQASYHCLKVLPSKAAHECELAASVLPKVTTPSDAIEIIRSYALEVRSRRTTLADLGDKYGVHLTMEAKAEGGYLLKCSNLQLSWRLESKSRVSPFQHRLDIDLDYMDEKYIKTITQAHKQLANPSLETHDRTLLLGIIITACLEANGVTPDMYESMESEAESVNLEKSKRKLFFEEPAAKKRKESRNDEANQIMAPPKSIPKKVKPKGKENVVDNRKKRLESEAKMASENVEVGDETANAKNAGKNKAKVQKNMEIDPSKVVENPEEGDKAKSNAKIVKNKENRAQNETGKEAVQSNTEEVENDEEVILASSNFPVEENKTKDANPKNSKPQKVGVNENESVATAKNDPSTKNKASVKNVESSQNVASKEKLSKKSPPTTKDSVEKHKTKAAGNKVASKEKLLPKKSVTKVSTEKEPNKDSNAKETENQNVADIEKAVTKKGITKDSVKNDKNKALKAPIKNVTKTGNTANTNLPKNLQSKQPSKKIESYDKNNTNIEKTNQKKDTESHAPNLRNSFSKHKQSDREIHKVSINMKEHKDKNEKILKTTKNLDKNEKPIEKNMKTTKYLSHKNVLSKKLIADKFLSKTGKENGGKIPSKIPQKKLSPVSERISSKNLLRISPRKMASIFKSTSDTNIRQLQKPITQIPRLLKKTIVP